MNVFKKQSITALGCLLLLAMSSTASAGHLITVDGNLSDWGVTLSGDTLNFGGLPVSPTNPREGSGTGTIGDFSFRYFIEDYDDGSPTNTFLGPHSGGQNYDSEFLGVGINNGYLVIAIATGQRTDNGYTGGHNPKHLYSPGDIQLSTSAGVYGIEVGGIDPGFDGKILAGEDGAYFTLNDGGYTLSETATTDKLAGSLWKDADWKLSPTTPNTPTQFQMDGGGTRVDDGTYGAIIYNYSFPAGSQHAFIEVAIPVGYFGDITLNSVRWAPACNNDFVETPNLNMHMPEPASIGLLLMGGLGLLGLRRRIA